MFWRLKRSSFMKPTVEYCSSYCFYCAVHYYAHHVLVGGNMPHADNMAPEGPAHTGSLDVKANLTAYGT